jgi:hypothetical protein
MEEVSMKELTGKQSMTCSRCIWLPLSRVPVKLNRIGIDMIINHQAMMLVLLEILRQVIQLNARRSFATKTFSMKSTAFGIPLNVPSYMIWRSGKTIGRMFCHYSNHGKHTS